MKNNTLIAVQHETEALPDPIIPHETMKDDLAELIRKNPGAVFTVDNDCWWMRRAPDKPIEEMSDEEYDKWRDTSKIADDETVISKGEGYGSGNCYGGDILQALAEIVGVKIESV